MSRKRKTNSFNRYIIRACIIVFMPGLLLWFLGNRVEAANELYVAGMPDGWPMEYYEEESKSFKGIIPDMLAAAGEAAGITIRYIQPSSADNRLALAENIQVDMISTLGLTSSQLKDAGLTPGDTIAYYMEGDTVKNVEIAYSASISEADRISLEKALQKAEPWRIQGLYSKYALKERRSNARGADYSLLYVAAFGVIVLLLISVYVRLLAKRKKLEELACRDEITGRDNFALWKRKMNEYIVDGNREHYAIIYLYGGLDVVRHIYGYEEAGNALKLFSDIAAEWIEPKTEGVARFNEFYFVFFVRYSREDGLKDRIEQLYEMLRRGFEQEKKSYFLDLAAGIYRLNSMDNSPMWGVQCSEIASEYARQHFLSSAFYNDVVEKETVSNYAMEHEAVHGLIHQEFSLYLQPLLHLKTGNIYGAEALVRWNNKRLGLLSPAQFLDVMKKKQLIGRMNLDIYKQGCRFLQKEASAGHKLHMLFNFTSENIGDEDFPDILKETAKQYGIEPEWIIVQLNEAREMDNSRMVPDTIKKLRAFGFNVWLSDLELSKVFFEFLECRVNGIKLGNELVGQIDTENGRKVMEHVLSLCRKLELMVLCVGAERQEHVEALKELDCELASGMYFYYPVTEEAFEVLLTDEG